MLINLNNLNKHGFIFHIYNPHDLVSSDDAKTVKNFKDYINNIINIPNENLYADFDTISPNQGIDLHYHVIPGSFQVVVWLPDYDFEGRHFLYGSPDEVLEFKPSLGHMCFMKPNDPKFIHGVSTLKSSKPVRSLGLSSLVKPFEEGMTYDIYV